MSTPTRDRRIGRALALRVLRGARPIITRSIARKTPAERLAEWRYLYTLAEAARRSTS